MATRSHRRRRTTQAPIQSRLDWSILPDELIKLISEKITFMEQYANLRLVCKEWRQACPPHPRHLTGQVPWLRLPQDPATLTLSFYDFSQSKTYNFDPPVVIGRHTPCSRGWFFIEEDMEILLYNPITRELKRNCLPSLASPPTVVEFARKESIKNPSHFDLQDEYCYYNKIKSHIHAVILTSNPSDEGCIVVAQFLHSEWDLGFCRFGDTSWTLLKVKEGSYGISILKYKNGLLYRMQDRGQITVYDLRVLSRKILIGKLSYAGIYDGVYLVIGEGEFDGVPLLVRRVLSDEIQVYRFSNGKARSTWRRVKNIGNSVLLLTNKECEMIPINNIELNDCEDNLIFVCEASSFPRGVCKVNLHGGVNIRMIKIEDGTIKDVPTSFPLFPLGSGFTTSLFTPSLC